jgi:hypothetical protein
MGDNDLRSREKTKRGPAGSTGANWSALLQTPGNVINLCQSHPFIAPEKALRECDRLTGVIPFNQDEQFREC